LLGSVLRSLQTPKQLICPAGQTHEPDTQTVPPPHVLPQAPQWLESLERLRHPPAQMTVPAPQVSEQEPEAHTWPDGHAPPQRPQFALSVATFTSHPLDATPSQLTKPGAQAPITQLPAEQAAPALAKRHTTPQPPQLLGSEPRTLNSQPLLPTRSQSPKPGAQASPQVPATQYAVALPAGQTVVHPPQCSGSLARSMHAPEQLVCPTWQLTTQVPPAQVVPPEHARPQAPQLALSVRVFTSQPLAARPSQLA
jgi:hypothetical protein